MPRRLTRTTSSGWRTARRRRRRRFMTPQAMINNAKLRISPNEDLFLSVFIRKFPKEPCDIALFSACGGRALVARTPRWGGGPPSGRGPRSQRAATRRAAC